jgi:repressor LexA
MNRIRALREKHEKTQQDLADFLNLSQKAVSFYELGQRDIPNDVLKKLANYFRVSTDYILGREDIVLYEMHDTKRVPVIGTVRCGAGGVAYEYIDEYISVDDTYRPDEMRGFRAEGDSMEGDFIFDGDICLVHLQEEVSNGDIAVVVICDDLESCEGTLKHVYKDADGTISLQASNPKYRPRFFKGEDVKKVHIVGKVVEVRRKLQ